MRCVLVEVVLTECVPLTEREVHSYHGHMSITSETYHTDLADDTSTRYRSLSADVKAEVCICAFLA